MNRFALRKGTTRYLRSVAALMAVVAASLYVVSAAHLSGHSTKAISGQGAGLPEAIIAVVLSGGAFVVWRSSPRARPVGLATVGFAIFGFLVGLHFTIGGGDPADLAYHLVTLPVLVGLFVALLRLRPSVPRPSGQDRPRSAPVSAVGDPS